MARRGHARRDAGAGEVVQVHVLAARGARDDHVEAFLSDDVHAHLLQRHALPRVHGSSPGGCVLAVGGPRRARAREAPAAGPGGGGRHDQGPVTHVAGPRRRHGARRRPGAAGPRRDRPRASRRSGHRPLVVEDELGRVGVQALRLVRAHLRVPRRPRGAALDGAQGAPREGRQQLPSPWPVHGRGQRPHAGRLPAGHHVVHRAGDVEGACGDHVDAL
mmetsp:Transcript_83101/g.179348  ORF Transcript_83101/g.179348 Transcript_83101/m.179348 type:complete len:218 (+) Transcript_83101:165-818(+)